MIAIPEPYRSVVELIHSHQRFIVIGHFRPDGDAIGSTIALAACLEQMGKDVVMMNEDAVPDRYAFLDGASEIQRSPQAPLDADVAISVDNGAWKRLGDASMAALSQIPLIANIDHHASNECFGDVQCIEAQEAATGMIIYKLIGYLGEKISPRMRDSLYAAISTDTGSFQYEKTTPEVMEIGAELIRLGVNVQEMNRQLYQEHSWHSLMLQREVLNGMKLSDDGLISSFALTMERKQELGVKEEDSADLIDLLRCIAGVKVSAIFEELPDMRIRVSLRSKDQRINVSEIAQLFHGGGHSLAAGIRMALPLKDAESKVMSAIAEALKKIV